MPTSWIDEVLSFWFEEIPPEKQFVKDASLDELIRARFEPLYEQVRRMDPDEHTTGPASLAAVVALDQFPRNMYRGDARAFATDALALAISRRAIERGVDQSLSPLQRMFLYMPWQHAEDRAAQRRSVELFAQLGLPQALDYAQRHREVIERFGRFPHRNAARGRASSDEELEFLKTHPGF